MSRRKGTQPEQYAGVFQEYSSIPARYRLETYKNQYDGKNTWESYRDNVLLVNHDTKSMRQKARLAGDSWQEHMQDRGRHHALATPADANAWCKELLDTGSTRRHCYEYYFLRIYDFYDHLKTNADHPHLYNPLLMAAINYDAARQLWMHRIDRRPEVVGRE